MWLGPPHLFLHGVQKFLKPALLPVSNLWDVLLFNANSLSIYVTNVIQEEAHCSMVYSSQVMAG